MEYGGNQKGDYGRLLKCAIWLGIAVGAGGQRKQVEHILFFVAPFCHLHSYCRELTQKLGRMDLGQQHHGYSSLLNTEC